MFIVFLTSIIALALTFLDSRKMLGKGMAVGFILITILGCIHYDYGNDYMAYFEIYNSIVNIDFDIADILAGNVYKEPVWALLCYFFKPIGGFFMMVAVLNIIQNVIVYKQIKKNVDRKWWPLAIFVYLFFTSFYLLNFSMMRQGLVICLFLGAWEFIRDKKCIKAFLILLLGATIHKSALILLPFAFVGLLPIRKGRIVVLIYLALYFVIWFGGKFMNDVMTLFLSFDEFREYGNAYGKDRAENTYRLGFVINLIPLILSLIYILKGKGEKDGKLMVALSIVQFIIAPFSEIMPAIGRVGMYFGVYQILALPRVYANVRNNVIRWGLLFILVAITLYGYIGFFNSDVFRDGYSEFKTIFSVI